VIDDEHGGVETMQNNGRAYVLQVLPDDWVMLADAQAEEFCGIACIKGTWLTSRDSNWATGRTAYVPVTHIKSITAFDSSAEMRSAFARSRDAQPGKPPSDAG
jgi:hypothetical protein